MREAVREGSRKDSSVWVKDQAELERKVALLKGKGRSGPGVDGSFRVTVLLRK